MKIISLIMLVLMPLVSGCSLLLQDVAPNEIAKLQPSVCPDLSGIYGQGETQIEGAHINSVENNSVLHLIALIPTEQEKNVDDIYQFFFDLSRPASIRIRKEINPNISKRYDYFLDGNKTNGAYVKFQAAKNDEYVVSVYSNSNQLVGAFITKLSSVNRLCHDGKFHSMTDGSNTTGPLPDGFMTMKRSLYQKDIFRSEKGALLITTSSRDRTVILGMVRFSTEGTSHVYTFPQFSMR